MDGSYRDLLPSLPLVTGRNKQEKCQDPLRQEVGQLSMVEKKGAEEEETHN